MIPLSCVICFSYSKMKDLETQRKYKSLRMRLEYDWYTNRKRRRKTCSSAGKNLIKENEKLKKFKNNIIEFSTINETGLDKLYNKIE